MNGPLLSERLEEVCNVIPTILKPKDSRSTKNWAVPLAQAFTDFFTLEQNQILVITYCYTD